MRAYSPGRGGCKPERPRGAGRLCRAEQALFAGPGLPGPGDRRICTISAPNRRILAMTRFFRSALSAAALSALLSAPALAAPEAWVLDPSHSQIVFTYDHLGFSTTAGMFSGFEGQIAWDRENPAASSVTVSFPVRSMLTGWQERFDHFMAPDFLDAAADEPVTFTSTAIEVTGEATAKITGDLTLNGVTQSVVLDARLVKADTHPMANAPWAGFAATTTLSRTAFNLGKFAPFVGDEVSVSISVEATKAP
jgi:polyisoprenoid-binding protein YceI